VSKRGLPIGINMRHDSHYVEELARSNRSIGKILPINKIVPNPDQPRIEIGDLTELTNSIKEKGVLEPLLVKPNKESGTWMIIAGERRWRSAHLAGLTEVPCIELDIDDQAVAEIALIENLQRKDLTVWEEADGLAALATRYNYTHEQIAKKIGKSRTTITESLTIAGIPEKIREQCLQSKISAKSTLLEIARQFDENEMLNFVEKISEKGLKREEIRKTLRPTSINPKTSDSKTTNFKIEKPSTTQIDNQIFKYSAKDKSFKLEMTFLGDFERKDILKALKEVFESVKSQKE
jgi:ParB family transcriptional regulator, chromosome partitioning protein